MISVGELFEKERCKADVSRERLASGICNQQLLYRALVDGTDMSVLTFEMLLERLNKSTDDLEYILSKNEYDHIIMRDMIEEAILADRIDDAKRLLEKYWEESENESKVDKMYYYRTMAAAFIYGGRNKNDYERALEYIIKAIRITLPEINADNYESYLFSTYEIENILMYIKILLLLGNLEKGSSLLVKMYSYIEKKWSDTSLLVRIIPKCVYLMIEYASDIIPDEELVGYCEKALTYLRKEAILFLLMPIMKKTISLYEKLNYKDKAEQLREYYQALGELYGEFSSGECRYYLFYRWKRTAYYLDYEVIKGERLNQRMKQADLAEGIYGNAASISNVEKGKQSPNKTKYEKLVKKLSLDKPRYSGLVVVDDFEKIEIIGMIRKTLAAGKIEDVLKMIDGIKSSNVVETRILEAYRVIALLDLKRISYEEAIKVMESSMGDWLKWDGRERQRRPFRAELDVIMTYLVVLNKLDENKELLILKNLLAINNKTNIAKQHNYRNLMSISLARVRACINKGMEENLLFKEAVSYCLGSNIGGALLGLFWSEAIRIKNTLGLERAEMYFYKGYILAELFMNNWAKNKREYYEGVFGVHVNMISEAGYEGSGSSSTRM